MPRSERLKKRLKRLMERRDALRAQALASADVNEVRSINAQIEAMNDDIADLNEEITEALAEEQQRAADPVASGTPVPEGAHRVGGSTPAEERNENPLESMEYRSAFMAYVQRGEAIHVETRNGEVISTVESGAAIPVTVMNEVINTVRHRYGNLYSKARKLSVPGGVKIPVGSLKASFKWISEETVSPRQKFDKLGAVTFGYNTAEIRIAQTFLSQILTLSAFEAEITRVIAEAYLEAMDYGIVNGSGDGSMLGILNDPRVTNTVTLTSSQFQNWKDWRSKFFAKLPLGYRDGEFIFPIATVDAYLETMSDNNNNPIFRQAADLVVNDGDAQNPNGRFFGRAISLVEPDIIPDFDTAEQGDVVGLFWQPGEYAINENFGFQMRRYFDEETNEWVDKAITVVDGKVLNPTGFVKIIKG